ncbi:hypothetical protein B0H15DRAFT_392412 [Mycena belliarum]|uniref:Uncharacterized protein n=1 Tax=Mycena belliarum TaxID=1033014 RepID=A0AAD6TZ03_9AGAR|nr:hypothetical protein B0H15DRAFT_392412 [Mycena belliae]
MNRLRKLSIIRVFHKESPVQLVDTHASTKPVYRGKTPLTVSDIHSRFPVDFKSFKAPCDEMGAMCDPCPDDTEHEIDDIVNSFPAPPPFRPVITNAHPDGPRFYFPMEDLFIPPPPDKVLETIEERNRTRTYEDRVEQQGANITSNASDSRRPLYGNSDLNMSTGSLGARANFKDGRGVQCSAAHQAHSLRSVRVQACSVTSVPEHALRRADGQPKRLYAVPQSERTRLRSVPTRLPAMRLAAAKEEPYRAYPSTVQGRSKRPI